jgi:predicted dehydrogenase
VKQVNWGIIGLGKVAYKFAEAFKKIDNARLLGISSRDHRKLFKFKDDFQIEEKYCYSEYENLLKCEDIDIVYIALPNSLHYNWIIKSIDYKKNILVEKPATVNFSEINKIKDKIKNKKLLFAEGFMYQYHPQTKKVIDLIKEGVIGEIQSMESYFGEDILTKNFFFGFSKRKKIDENNRKYNKQLGGGAILDLGCYPSSFSIIIASLKENIDLNNIIYSNASKEVLSSGIDLDSYLELNFDNKFISKIGASFTKNLGKHTKIIGKKGEILIENTWHASPGSIKIINDKKNKIILESKNNIFSYEIELLSKYVNEGKQKPDYPAMNLNETRLNMNILEKWINYEK